MSLATRLEDAIRERDIALVAVCQMEQAFDGRNVRNADCSEARRLLIVAQNKVNDWLQHNESAILSALRFLEAVERHGISLEEAGEGRWEASGSGKWAVGTTAPEAVQSLVAQLEKAK